MIALETVGAAEAAPLALPRPAPPGHAMPCASAPNYAMPCDATRRDAEPIAWPGDPQPYFRKLHRVLDRMGSLYTVDDLLTRIAEGKMQSFTVNNSWAITQIEDFPRARQLQILAVIGDLKDIDELHAQILVYADKVNAGLLSTHGRLGWLREGSFRRLGWRLKAKSQLYQKEM